MTVKGVKSSGGSVGVRVNRIPTIPPRYLTLQPDSGVLIRAVPQSNQVRVDEVFVGERDRASSGTGPKSVSVGVQTPREWCNSKKRKIITKATQTGRGDEQQERLRDDTKEEQVLPSTGSIQFSPQQPMCTYYMQVRNQFLAQQKSENVGYSDDDDEW